MVLVLIYKVYYHFHYILGFLFLKKKQKTTQSKKLVLSFAQGSYNIIF